MLLIKELTAQAPNQAGLHEWVDLIWDPLIHGPCPGVGKHWRLIIKYLEPRSIEPNNIIIIEAWHALIAAVIAIYLLETGIFLTNHASLSF